MLSQDFSGVLVPAMPSGWQSTFTSGGFAAQGWTTADTSNQLYGHVIPVIPSNNKYVLVNEWNWPYNALATVTSPAFSCATASNPYLKFDYYYFAGNNGNTANAAEKAWVNLSINGGATWTTVDTLQATAFAWGTRYVNLIAAAGAASVKVQFVYKDGGAHMYGCALDNIRVFDVAPHDLTLTALKPFDADPATAFYPVGANVQFSGTVSNQGAGAVNAFNVSYKIGSGAVQISTISGLNIPTFGSYNFSFPISYTITAGTAYPVKAWVTLALDTNQHNDSATTRVYGYSHRPHKNVFFEEGTGTWCGYCVRGIVYMDSLWKLYDTSASIVAVHVQNDPMKDESAITQNYADFIGKALQYSYPGIYVDRYKSGDPMDAFVKYNEARQNFGLGDLSISSLQIATGMLNLTVKMIPATALTGDYRLQLILTEDNVHNTGSTYTQTNYYSYQDENLPLSGSGYNFQDSVKYIPGSSMYYRFVARSATPDLYASANGVAGSLPAGMQNGTAYTYSFNSIPLSANWQNSNLRATVVLINGVTGVVYNSVHSKLSLETADVQISNNVPRAEILPNPAKDNASLLFELPAPARVVVSLTDIIGRTMYYKEQQLGKGKNFLNIPVDQLEAGNYSVQLSAGMMLQNLRLTVVR